MENRGRFACGLSNLFLSFALSLVYNSNMHCQCCGSPVFSVGMQAAVQVFAQCAYDPRCCQYICHIQGSEVPLTASSS
jgi:hypothetical protein